MSWPVYEAKARFSELLETAVTQGPQVVTSRGVEKAVLVSIEEWKRLRSGARPTIKDVLLDPNGPFDLPDLPRATLKLRPFEFED